MSDVMTVPDKGLRKRAINTVEGSALGIASTAPAYSLAATVGIMVAAAGGAAPWVLFASFIPVLGVALAMRELNRAEPDCGTIFAWTSRAFGPTAGFLTSWVAIMACVLVMGNLAQIAGIYLMQLVGADGLADNVAAQVVLGMAFIAGMSFLAVRGIELSARAQGVLVVLEIVALAVFSIFALAKADNFTSNLSLGGGDGAFGAAMLAAVFLYWGWDSAFSVNEESDDPREVPAKAAVISLLVVAGLYLLVSVSALGYAGQDKLAANEDDFFAALSGELFGTWGGKLLVLAIMVSAAASILTTVIPTARQMLSMATRNVLPRELAAVHPQHQTPHKATWLMAGASAILYALLLWKSEDVLADSVAATGILIALYFAVTCFTVPAYFGADARFNLTQRVVLPTITGLFFIGLTVYAALDSTPLSLIVAAISISAGGVVLVMQRNRTPSLT